MNESSSVQMWSLSQPAMGKHTDVTAEESLHPFNRKCAPKSED